MYLLQLNAQNFRNYTSLNWHPEKGINLLLGENAQGKTNILEAIFILTSGRSFRTAREKDLISHGSSSCRLNICLEENSREFLLGLVLNQEGKTGFFLNDVKKTRNKLYSPPMALSFTPSDLDFIRGTPAGRRRWLDLELGFFDIKYSYNLYQYNKILSQKNYLLKSYAGHRQLSEMLEPWNIQMALYGSKVMYTRLKLLGKLSPHFKLIYKNLTHGKEETFYKYLSSIVIEEGINPESIMNSFSQAIKNSAKDEAKRMQSLVGPHKDDINFFINGRDTRYYSSRGQQRSIILALKMSLIDLYRLTFNQYPILLMDDVFLELDDERQRGLIDTLPLNMQVFITSNGMIGNLINRNVSVYKIKRGHIERE